MEATSIGRRRRPRNASEDRGLTDTEDESEDEQQEEVGSDEEGLDYLQLFAAAISALRDEEKDDEGAEEEEEDGAQKVKRRRLVQPLEAAYAHFEQQDAHLQQAAAFGKMLLEKNKQLEEQLEVYQNSSILNEYQDKIRMQQEKIWELQAQEENVRTELEELKVELKVKKRMLNSKSRLAEQLEAKLWDYIQKIEKEKESRDNEENKKMKKEMEQREKMRRLSDEVENYKEELKEAKSESERLRKQVTNLLDKLSTFRGDLTRERERKSRSNSFSRRLTSFFVSKNENGEAIGENEDDGDGSDCESHGSYSYDSDADVSSAPGSRRQSGRGRQQLLAVSTHDGSDGAVVELKEKTQRAKQENESLRRELSALAEDHTRLRESVTAMRDHERRLEKERKRERKLLAQAQQTIEELKLRIIDAQLLSSTTTPASPPSTPLPSHKLPLSYSLPSTPFYSTSHPHPPAGAVHASPLPAPSTPQTYHHHQPLQHQQQTFSPRPQYQQSQQTFSPRPQYYHEQLTVPSSPPALFAELQQQEAIERSVRDELAAIDDILLGDDDDLGLGTTAVAPPRIDNTITSATTPASAPAAPTPASAPAPLASGEALLVPTPRAALTPRSASMPALASSSSGAEDKDKRVWVVAEGQRGRGSDNAGEGGAKAAEAEGAETDVSAELGSGGTTKRASDGRLFIFAEELEKKVVQKFVYDEEELKAGLQEEVEACVADFLAKREQELQAIQPAVLKERRKRALSCERDDLLLFFGVFLTAAAAKSDDTAMLLPADSTIVGSSSSADGDEDSDDQDGVAEGNGEEDDGWCILDEWRTGRQKRTSANGNAGKVVESLNNAAGASTDVGVSVSTSSSGTRSRMGSISSSSGVSLGSMEGKSVAAVQTWVKHIPFDFGATKRQSSREENEFVAAATTTTSSATPSPQPTPFAPPTSGADLDEELAIVEAAISGTPRATATPAIIETTTTTATALQQLMTCRGEAAVTLPVGVSDEERERIRAEMARLNGQLAARRKEVEEALRPIVAIVPATTVNARVRCSSTYGPHRDRSFHFLDLVLYD